MALVLDALCLVVFVIAGRQSHGLDNGAGWFLVVLWPIAVAWFATALVAGLYTAPSRAWWRLAATVVLGVGLGLVVRIAVTHRDTPAAFVLVAYAFITLTTVGWRLVGAAVPWVVARGRR
ncbi:MAG: DUF3054 domain-containing protein [Candidatus Dormibacteraeota bacterium]|nr:DUF3054 domain-containing protein [Candidatus Dormibacteraeota bacterium]